jgi:hypothetical protein
MIVDRSALAAPEPAAPELWTPAGLAGRLFAPLERLAAAAEASDGLSGDAYELAVTALGFLIVVGVPAAICALIWIVAAPAEDPTDSSRLVAAFAVTVTATALVAAHVGAGRLLRRLAEEERDTPLVAVAPWHVAALAAACAAAWLARPLLHGPAMLLYVYPLVTWIPLGIALAVPAACAAVAALAGRGARSGLRYGLAWRTVVGFASWALFMALLPGWQGHALYAATPYLDTTSLPPASQPRLLPKVAARDRGELRDAHLVVDPSSGELVWSAEHKAGAILRGASDGVVLQPLDRVAGRLRRTPDGISPAVSEVGPGSLTWRAAQRHFFTRVQERVVVPLGGGRAVAVAPYLGYRGFPVRRPYVRGIYVLHQDGTLEDLTPQQALRRRELARSGRLFPEKLARRVAASYGYGRRPTVIDDPPGNPQPYLTNLGDGQIEWITVGHPPGDRRTVSAVFLTDAATGTTRVWHAPHGVRLLSNEGAVELARSLPIQWTDCCDSDNGDYDIRYAVEPRPVFARGRLYYLVSIVPDRHYLQTPEPVDRTVVVDAERRRIAMVVDHAYPGADARLRAFFR